MPVIRPMRASDREELLALMRAFYDSPAVLTKAPDEVLARDIDSCVGPCPFLEGYVAEEEGTICGYCMCALSFSTEFGGVCVWVEDLCVRPAWRGQGLGTRFLRHVEEMHPEAVRFRLEAEADNARAIRLYTHMGYRPLPYLQLTRER